MHIHTFIYIHLYIHIYIYLYAQLVISIHKVRQGKLQTASCWAHAPTSCSGDMFNAKSMPKSDQNLEKLDVVVAVGFRSIIIYIYKDVQLKHPVKTGTLFFFFFWLVLEKRTLRSTRTPLKQLLTFFQLVQYTKTSPNGCNGWLFCVRVSQQGEAIRLLQGVLEPEEELGCHLGFFQRLTMLGCQRIIKHVNVIW